MRVGDLPTEPEFAAAANAGPELQAAADADRLAFWDTQAKRLDWATEWSQVLDWSDAPVAKWFVGGSLNVAYNCMHPNSAAQAAASSVDHAQITPVGEVSSTSTSRPATVTASRSTSTGNPAIPAP